MKPTGEFRALLAMAEQNVQCMGHGHHFGMFQRQLEYFPFCSLKASSPPFFPVGHNKSGPMHWTRTIEPYLRVIFFHVKIKLSVMEIIKPHGLISLSVQYR
jgi:hypothetical protein